MTTTMTTTLRRPILFALLLVLPWLPACVSGSVSVYPGQNFAPTDPSEVQVYHFFPDAPSVKVGEVQVTGATGTDWSKYEDEIRRKAASIGGQGVVIVSSRNQLLGISQTPSQFQRFTPGGVLSREEFFYPGTVYPQSETTLLGIVLRFPAGAPRPPEGKPNKPNQRPLKPGAPPSRP